MLFVEGHGDVGRCVRALRPRVRFKYAVEELLNKPWRNHEDAVAVTLNIKVKR